MPKGDHWETQKNMTNEVRNIYKASNQLTKYGIQNKIVNIKRPTTKEIKNQENLQKKINEKKKELGITD